MSVFSKNSDDWGGFATMEQTKDGYWRNVVRVSGDMQIKREIPANTDIIITAGSLVVHERIHSGVRILFDEAPEQTKSFLGWRFKKAIEPAQPRFIRCDGPVDHNFKLYGDNIATANFDGPLAENVQITINPEGCLRLKSASDGFILGPTKFFEFVALGNNFNVYGSENLSGGTVGSGGYISGGQSLSLKTAGRDNFFSAQNVGFEIYPVDCVCRGRVKVSPSSESLRAQSHLRLAHG